MDILLNQQQKPILLNKGIVRESIEKIMSRDVFTHVISGIMVDKYAKYEGDIPIMRSLLDNLIEYFAKTGPRIILVKTADMIGVNLSGATIYLTEGVMNIATGILYRFFIDFLSKKILPLWVSNASILPWTDLFTEVWTEVAKEFGSQLANMSWDTVLAVLPKQL